MHNYLKRYTPARLLINLCILQWIHIRYSIPRLKPWEGRKAIWHLWHDEFQVYEITYEEYLKRLISIYRNKPKSEKPIRYKLIRPVKGHIRIPAISGTTDENVLLPPSAIKTLHAIECPHCIWDETINGLLFKT